MIDDAVAVEDDEFGGGCHHSFRKFFNAVRNKLGLKLPSPASGRGGGDEGGSGLLMLNPILKTSSFMFKILKYLYRR